jgi:toxin ParE1/3/4
MLNIEASSEAESDLLSIWLHIAADQPLNADRFLDKLQAAIDRLAEFPLLGVERQELASGIRSFYVDRYVIYYMVSGTSLVVVRVLSSDMDSQQYF